MRAGAAAWWTLLAVVTFLLVAVVPSTHTQAQSTLGAPGGLAATGGDGQVKLSWTANTEPTLAGYNVYRGTSLPVNASGTPVNGPTPVTTSAYTDTKVTNGTTYHYAVRAVDTAGNQSAPSSTASATPKAVAPKVDTRVNFQSETAPVPPGYLRDFGEAFGARTGASQGSDRSYGWVTPGTSTPLSLTANGRDRNRAGIDQRLDTIVHMQLKGSPNGAWELSVPDATYRVTVGVGDQPSGATYDSRHSINVEGSSVIDRFAGSAAREYEQATTTVRVSDGRLTIDAAGGSNTKINYVEVVTDDGAASQPALTGTAPRNGATGVRRDAGVVGTVSLPNVGGNVDPNTLTPQTVRLVRLTDGAQVPANVNTSGGGDVIVAQPKDLLSELTKYRFEVTPGVKDTTGAPFLPYASTFTTGTAGGADASSPAKFDKVDLPNAVGKSFTSVTMGPDGKLYAGTIEGEILRFPLNADGTTGTAEVIDSVQRANGAPRMLIGLTFDPASTASNPVLWVSHSTFAFNEAPDWGGKISRLSGANLERVQDYVVDLPRSYKDHLTNSIAFGPDGAMYVSQGSNTAMGAPDNAWGQRHEHLLNAAVLRIDPQAIAAPPLNVKTDEGGSYDPFASGAPVKIHATGIRNAYDLVWHSNGQLYAPANGSAAGGNAPGTPSPLTAACQNRVDDGAAGDYTGPPVPEISGVAATQDDFLFRVAKGGYYGHPNPKRCEWVMNGGDPTAGQDLAEVAEYPDGTQPDRNWRGAAFGFANNRSPNGAIEYKSNVFGGALKGKLLIARYSLADDIIALTPGGGSLDIVGAQTGITGFSGFTDPLDLVENTANGNLYVTEYGAQKITLLRPAADTMPPVAKPPVESFPLNASLGATAVPVRLDFSATDTAGSGVARYELEQSTNGGSYAPVTLPSATATNITRPLMPGAYRFRVRAQDAAGNWSPWAEGPSFSLGAHQENDAAVVYAGGPWTRAALSGAYGGSVAHASAPGASATFPFTGNEVSWVAPRGPERGVAEVWVDGAKAATVDLYSATDQPRKAVFRKTFASVGDHKIEVRVTGVRSAAATGTRIDVDAFVTLR